MYHPSPWHCEEQCSKDIEKNALSMWDERIPSMTIYVLCFVYVFDEIGELAYFMIQRGILYDGLCSWLSFLHNKKFHFILSVYLLLLKIFDTSGRKWITDNLYWIPTLRHKKSLIQCLQGACHAQCDNDWGDPIKVSLKRSVTQFLIGRYDVAWTI